MTSIAISTARPPASPEPSLAALDRRALLARDKLVALARPNPRKVMAALLTDLALIAAAAAACELYFSAAAYVLAVLVIGGRQVGIGTIALHDGAHGYVHPDRRVNDLVCELLTRALLIPALGQSLRRYSVLHVDHHRHTNTARDPDYAVYCHFHSLSRGERVRMLLGALSGVLLVRNLLQSLKSSGAGRRAGFAAAAAALAAACWWGFHPARLLLSYWLVPLATWGFAINTVRRLSEHYPGRADLPPVLFTRDILPSWFDLLFVATRGVNYHLSHHLFPSVPFFNLKALQAELAAAPAYRAFAHVTRGYHRVVLELCAAEPVPRHHGAARAGSRQ